MPTIFTHALLGYSLARLMVNPGQVEGRYWLFSATLPVIPDLDTLFMPWIPYSHPLGHRGLSHSPFFAGILALATICFSQKTSQVFPSGRLGLMLFYWIITASHGILDAMTDGGLGIAFFAPFTNNRYFLPFRLIPVAPIGVYRFFSAWGLEVFLIEVILFWFFALAMIVWSWKDLPFRKIPVTLLVLVGMTGWVWRFNQVF